MRMRIRLVAYLLLLIFSGIITATPAVNSTNQKHVNPAASVNLLNRYRYKYRNPFLAGFLSSMMWGTGQIYSGEYTRGSLLVFGDLIFKGLLVGLALKLNNRYSTGEDDPVRWAEFSSTDKGLVIGYIVTYLGLTVFSTVDAARCARNYNKRHTPGGGLHFTLADDRGGAVLRFGWGLPF